MKMKHSGVLDWGLLDPYSGSGGPVRRYRKLQFVAMIFLDDLASEPKTIRGHEDSRDCEVRRHFPGRHPVRNRATSRNGCAV